MGALPKRRISKKRKNERRSHDALKSAQLVRCSSCKALKKPHHVCSNCGKYKDKQVIN